MNKAKWYEMRHNVRACGRHWNEHSELVKATLLTTYDGPPYWTLKDAWRMYKDDRGWNRTWIKNVIRSNVRHDSRSFTQQLTEY